MAKASSYSIANLKLKPLWVEMYSIDKGSWTNPGVKYAHMLRLIADRISQDYNEELRPRNETPEQVSEWLREQATKADNHDKCNYHWLDPNFIP